MTSQAASARARSRRVAGVSLSLLLGVLGLSLSTAAPAAPIVYTFSIDGANTSGSLGKNSFSNAILSLTFTADTRDVIAFSMPASGSMPAVSGYEILKGVGTIFIFDTSTSLQYTATFMPSAKIFVSVDSTNNGIGFGSAGVLPTNSTFPGKIAYPEGVLTLASVGKFGLKTNFTISGYAISCEGFPISCLDVGTPLATSAGDLVLNHQTNAYSTFEAQLQTPPFATFQASATVTGSKPHNNFSLSGSFTLGTGDAIYPLTDLFTLEFGPYLVTLPAGSFVAVGSNVYQYSGTVSGVALTVKLTRQRLGAYSFTATGTNVDLTGITNPAELVLTIGYNTGTIGVAVP